MESENMAIILSKLKQRLSSKQKLRHIKNSLEDDIKSIKHKLNGNSRINKESIIQETWPVLTESEKKEKHRELLLRNDLLELHKINGNEPLISVIIFNGYSKDMLLGFNDQSGYQNNEIILIVSDEDKKPLIDDFQGLNLKIVTYNGYESEILNQTANYANGDYILFLNGQTETTFGWLNQLVKTAVQSNSTMIGTKIIYGNVPTSEEGNDYSYRIMSTGIGFRTGADGIYEPYNFDEGCEPLIDGLQSTEPRAAVSINGMLVKRDVFQLVKGFTHQPSPYKEADLCLKIHEKGYAIVYNPNSILIMNDMSVDQGTDPEFKDLNYQKTFKQRWQTYLIKNVLLDKLDGNKIFSNKALKLTFLVTEKGNGVSAGDYFTALEFGEFLAKFGWEINYLAKNGPEYWYEVDETVDVVISLLDIFDPRRIKCSNSSLIKIAWPRNWFDRWISHPGFKTYDIILTPSKTSAKYVKEHTGLTPFIMPLATNSDRFNTNITPKKEYICDYCFTGSYWKYAREIEQMLDPETLPYTFKLYGKNWENSDKFKKYYYGFVKYSKLPEIYASTKLVIDDANNATKRYGSVNSRVYDAIAAGAMVITNGNLGAEEIFGGELPVFKSKDELNGLIDHYLKNEEERLFKVDKLQKIVLERHSYKNRAETLKKILKEQF